MRKQLYSLCLLAGMVLTVACSARAETGSVHITPETSDEQTVVIPAISSEQETHQDIQLQEVEDTEETEDTEEETCQRQERSFDWDADENYLLAKIAMAEAEGESTEGKALVMLVVLNRVWSDEFPDSIEEVLFQRTSSGGWQFSPMREGGRWHTTEPNEDCYAALDLIMEGWDESDGALYFESSEDPTWHSEHLEFLYKVGRHKFYR